MACQVLRCSGEARHLRNVGKPGGPRLDAVVCDGHQAAIEAGADWYLEPADRVIYMGDDLRARRLMKLANVEVFGDIGYVGGMPEGHARVRLTLQNLAGGHEEHVELVVDGEARRHLERTLEWLRPHE
ncbi:MAG: hypothetical protein M3P70_09535 [Actinomycetota bacterium]|nr:hypothetical protein [Actinomycetota bacterium]